VTGASSLKIVFIIIIIIICFVTRCGRIAEFYFFIFLFLGFRERDRTCHKSLSDLPQFPFRDTFYGCVQILRSRQATACFKEMAALSVQFKDEDLRQKWVRIHRNYFMNVCCNNAITDSIRISDEKGISYEIEDYRTILILLIDTCRGTMMALVHDSRL